MAEEAINVLDVRGAEQKDISESYNMLTADIQALCDNFLQLQVRHRMLSRIHCQMLNLADDYLPQLPVANK